MAHSLGGVSYRLGSDIIAPFLFRNVSKRTASNTCLPTRGCPVGTRAHDRHAHGDQYILAGTFSGLRLQMASFWRWAIRARGMPPGNSCLGYRGGHHRPDGIHVQAFVKSSDFVSYCPFSTLFSMPENLAKSLLYFRSLDSFIGLSPQTGSFAGNPKGPLDEYPLDLISKLTDGHFDLFDRAGLPLRRNRSGGEYHNYSTLCTFASAHWQAYLRFASTASLDFFLAVSRYICMTVTRPVPGIALLRMETPSLGHVGGRSALYHGEAISVLCRAYQVTGIDSFLRTAEELMPAYTIPIAEGGLLGCVEGLPWYEEYPDNPAEPHVLNGMISAIWGVRDLYLLNQDNRARELFENGVDSIIRALPLFDTGAWSLYSLATVKAPSIASMKYHFLHILQLRALTMQTGRPEPLHMANIFSGYAASPLKRLAAGFHLAQRKVKKRL
jgi:hypothetical protein